MKIRTFLAEHFFDLRVISRIQCFKMSRQSFLKGHEFVKTERRSVSTEPGLSFSFNSDRNQARVYRKHFKRRNRKWRKIKWFNILAICKRWVCVCFHMIKINLASMKKSPAECDILAGANLTHTWGRGGLSKNHGMFTPWSNFWGLMLILNNVNMEFSLDF